MTSVTIGVAKMPVKVFLFWAFSAALCVISAASALKQTVNAEDAEDAENAEKTHNRIYSSA